MADLLSITASVAGITTAALQSAQFLVKTIENIKDAPSTIKELTADLRVVELVLHQLIASVQGESEQVIGRSQILPAVENCERACKTFQLQVERWTKHSKEDKLFWMIQWKIGLFGQERINTFRGQLNDCKSTLNIALTVASLCVSPRIHPILLVANLLNRLVVINQKDLVKAQKDSILEVNRADFEQELTRASTELVHIKRVTATNDGVALAGVFNVLPGEHSRIRQDISDVYADSKGFVIAGWANDVNITDMRR